MTQSPENGQKPHFGPNFDHFWPFGKKSEKSNGGIYENFWDGQTELVL